MPEDYLDLDAIVPRDFEIRFRGKSYWIPGDMDVETTYRLQDLYNGLVLAEGFQDGKEPDEEKARALTLELRKEIAALMTAGAKVRDADAEDVKVPPGGAQAMAALTIAVLKRVGFGADEPDPPKPVRKTQAKRKKRKK